MDGYGSGDDDGFGDNLRKGTGLGQGPDGMVEADDSWWQAKAGGNKELLALKNGWPPYLEEMDMMFTKTAADGSTAYAPGQGTPRQASSSQGTARPAASCQGTPPAHINIDDDEEEAEAAAAADPEDPIYDDQGVNTSVSIGSKRSSSSRSVGNLRSTADSPSKKKCRSPAIRAMIAGFDRLTSKLDSTSSSILEKLQTKWTAPAELWEKVMKLARECGATETDVSWLGLFNTLKDRDAVQFFLDSESAEGRLQFLRHQATMHPRAKAVAAGEGSQAAAAGGQQGSESSADRQEQVIKLLLVQHEAVATAASYGMSVLAQHIEKYCCRSAYRVVEPGLSGLDWVERNLQNRDACYDMYRMTPNMFHKLHDLLVDRYDLPTDSSRASSIEAVGMFLWIVGAPQSVRQARNRFERSLGTVHNMFHVVLKSLVMLANDYIKPRDPQFVQRHERLNSPRFDPWFKNCIGAIDGTHVPCIVPKDLLTQYMCRKGMMTQNVMACCDFDLLFTFALGGWPGSVHDMRVFDCAMTKYGDVFPHPPPGKFYLVDSGYANRPGYLAPYRNTRYHLQDFERDGEPQGKEELFNKTHSYLRNCIERAIGVLKQKFRILFQISRYPLETQTHIIVACMALHNFIRMSGLRDRDFGRCDRSPN